MPGGRGRGLGGIKALAEVFTPEPEEPKYKNIWDDPQYAWSKPTDTTLRDYLTGSNYWGYKDWAPGAADVEDYRRHGDVYARTKTRGGYAERTPEHLMSRRIKKMTNPADKMAVNKAMRAEWIKYKPGVPNPVFTLLQKLRFMEGRGTKVPMSYTGREGYDRFAGRPGTGGGGQEGGGKGGLENRALSPTARPRVTPMQRFGQGRPRATFGRQGSLRDIFNGTGGRRW